MRLRLHLSPLQWCSRRWPETWKRSSVVVGPVVPGRRLEPVCGAAAGKQVEGSYAQTCGTRPGITVSRMKSSVLPMKSMTGRLIAPCSLLSGVLMTMCTGP